MDAVPWTAWDRLSGTPSLRQAPKTQLFLPGQLWACPLCLQPSLHTHDESNLLGLPVGSDGLQGFKSCQNEPRGRCPPTSGQAATWWAGPGQSVLLTGLVPAGLRLGLLSYPALTQGLQLNKDKTRGLYLWSLCSPRQCHCLCTCFPKSDRAPREGGTVPPVLWRCLSDATEGALSGASLWQRPALATITALAIPRAKVAWLQPPAGPWSRPWGRALPRQVPASLLRLRNAGKLAAFQGQSNPPGTQPFSSQLYEREVRVPQNSQQPPLTACSIPCSEPRPGVGGSTLQATSIGTWTPGQRPGLTSVLEEGKG